MSFEQELIEYNDVQGKPRSYKNRLLIHPVKMRDAFEFYQCVQVLNISQADTNNVDIMEMSYLKFLLVLSASKGNEIVSEKLAKLLKLVFHAEKINLDVNDKGKYSLILDDDSRISEFDFSKIRTIISEQNMVDLDDDDVNPEVKAKLKESREFMAKRSTKPASLTQRILAYQYEMKLTIDQVMDMTLYQFNRSLETINHVKHADILQQARYVGMNTFKDEHLLPTWLSAIEKGEDPLIVDAEELKKNMNATFNK